VRLSELDEIEKGAGYRVLFERRVSGGWGTDSTPEHGEPLLGTESEAWDVAQRIADAMPDAVNIYVILVKNGRSERVGTKEFRSGYGGLHPVRKRA
jgi:hypothetical protein